MEGERLKRYQRAMSLIEQGHKILRELEDPNVIHLPKKPHKPIGATDQFVGCLIKEKLLAEVTHELQKKWISAYPTMDIGIELLKADMWINTNPSRAPKNFGRFFTSWLSRSYESYRKNPVQRGLNQEGFYMTQAMKVSHNNQLQLSKIKESMNVEEREVGGTAAANGRVP